jgi:hypothetical protein
VEQQRGAVWDNDPVIYMHSRLATVDIVVAALVCDKI